jgi:hypothetical protein
VATYAEKIALRVERLRKNNADRDARMVAVAAVQSGRANQVFKGIFPSDWPMPVVQNTIKSAAEDTAMMVGVLPSLVAASSSSLDESKSSRSDKLTRIIGHLAYASNLGTELVYAAHQLSSYGFVPFRVEPNFDEKRPHIAIDSCMGTYFEKDRFDRLVTYSRVVRMRASELAALYPEYAGQLTRNTAYGRDTGDEQVEVVRYYDDDQIMLFVPQRKGLVLENMENVLGRIPVRIADYKTLDGETRGQFDDALWVYAAKARLALLNLEAAQKAVEAPIALPADVQEFSFGPDAILRSNSPEKIRRVGIEVPNSSMFEMRALDEELKLATHYPDVRAGQTDASIVTGRGVQALMGGFDTRIKSAQAQLGAALADALSIALDMDKKMFPKEHKTVYASVNGTSYELKYTPEKDIYSNSVSAEYGLMAGLDPNRALVWSLQALGAGLVSKRFVMNNLPINLNVVEEERTLDVESLRAATMAAVQGYAQAIPQLATQGQDPTEIINNITEIINARKKGIPIEEATGMAFAPKPPSPEEQAAMDEQAAMQQGGQPGGEDPMAAMMAMGGQPPQPGQPQPGMPGQPQQGPADIQTPNQPPSMQQLLTQLSGDGRDPRMSARTVRQRLL